MIVSFLSDYGASDEFAGVVKAVITRLAPGSEVVDVTHAVTPFDVRTGALALWRAAPYLVPGIVLAIVDPGVGTGRPPVAVEVEDGHLVGPDNGLLVPAADRLGGARRVSALTNPSMRLASPGPTFAGRDVMAPAVAHLCGGGPIEDLGKALDPEELVRVGLPGFRREGDALVAEVAWIDRFGNVQLAVDADRLAPSESYLVGKASGAGHQLRVARARSYADVKSGAVGLVVDSHGRVSLAMDRASASQEIGLALGDEVRVVPAG